MVNWESQSKTSPQSPEDGHIYCILLIRIAFFYVSENCREHVIDACEARDGFLCDLGSTRERESKTFRLKHSGSSPALLPLIMMSTHSLVA